jgi:hypothetical protein
MQTRIDRVGMKCHAYCWIVFAVKSGGEKGPEPNGGPGHQDRDRRKNSMPGILYSLPKIVKKFKTIEYSGGTTLALICRQPSAVDLLHERCIVPFILISV